MIPTQGTYVIRLIVKATSFSPCRRMQYRRLGDAKSCDGRLFRVPDRTLGPHGRSDDEKEVCMPCMARAVPKTAESDYFRRRTPQHAIDAVGSSEG